MWKVSHKSFCQKRYLGYQKPSQEHTVFTERWRLITAACGGSWAVTHDLENAVRNLLTNLNPVQDLIYRTRSQFSSLFPLFSADFGFSPHSVSLGLGWDLDCPGVKLVPLHSTDIQSGQISVWLSSLILCPLESTASLDEMISDSLASGIPHSTHPPPPVGVGMFF